MSRAYEELLANYVERLDRLIADTAAVRAKSDDPTTLRQIGFDLDRWSSSRARFATILVRTKRWNRLTSLALAIFGISFGCLLIFALFGEPTTTLVFLLLGLDLLILFASAIGYLIAITLRDAVAREGQPWRFSLRSVLIVMTEIALALGTLAWLMRK
jgi:uncharacterized membrane protein